MQFPILTLKGDHMPGTPNTIGKLARVSRATAAKVHAEGHMVIIVPHKMMPWKNTQSLSMVIPTDAHFDNLVSQFTYANCSWEVGYYPAFYARFHSYAEVPAYSGKYQAII